MTVYTATAPILFSSASDKEADHRLDGAVEFKISTEFACRYDPADEILWARTAPRGIPCFTLELLRDMEKGSSLIEHYFSETRRPLRYIALRSGSPAAFNVGGDLAYFLRLIATQDRTGLTEYARAAVNVCYRNYTAHNLAGLTTVAVLEGNALGGGFESALSCDIVIAERHVKAGFPEVLFNMFPGMGGLSFLSRRVGRRIADELTRSGRLYGAQELLDLGVIDQVVPTGQAVDAVLRLMSQRAHQEQAHVAMNTVDQLLRPVTLDELNRIVQLWVECAMQLSPRGQAWMRRLHQQQLAKFARPFEVAVHLPEPMALAA
jgi:DSF synthase